MLDKGRTTVLSEKLEPQEGIRINIEVVTWKQDGELRAECHQNEISVGCAEM